MRPPVFGMASDDRDIVAFESLEDAEGYAEPWDVNDGLWRFWDSHGRVLAAPGRIDERRSWTQLTPTTELEPEVLRSEVLRCLKALDLEPAPDDLPLDELCRLASDWLWVESSSLTDWQPLRWLREQLLRLTHRSSPE